MTANTITAARSLEDRLPQDTKGPFQADGERLYLYVDVANEGEAQELLLACSQVGGFDRAVSGNGV